MEKDHMEVNGLRDPHMEGEECLRYADIPDWAYGLNCAVTVCDSAGIVLYMNERSRATFAKRGDLIGKSLMDCHNDRSKEIIRRLLETGGENVYTIEKAGVRKLIYQSAWKVDGTIKGLCEISIVLPDEIPHHVRK